MQQNSKPPTERKDSPRRPVDLERIRHIKEILSIFGNPTPSKFEFKAGETLIREGQSLSEQPALLVMQGKLEERKTLVLEGYGITEQVLSILSEGDIANTQGIVPELSDQTAFCALHAIEDGYGFIITPHHIKHLESLGILLNSLLRQNAKQWEAFSKTSTAYSVFALLLHNLKRDFPKIPVHPNEFLRQFQKVSSERNELRLIEARHRLNAEKQATANREISDRVAELEHELLATQQQLSHAQKTRAEQQPSQLSQKIMELENANAALRRDKLKLSENLKITEEELKSQNSKLALEERTRKALEQRNADLTKQLAAQNSAASSARFPSANILLESTELSDLESGAKRFRDAAAHFESLAIMMQRAMELIAEDNPGMVISKDVMMLMTGEEPPARPSVEKARARRDSKDFKTIHLGSESPEVAAAKAGVRAEKSHKQTDRNIAHRLPDPQRNATVNKSEESDESPDDAIDEILKDFVVKDDSNQIPQSIVPSSTGVNVPFPRSSNLGDTWDNEPDTGSRPTRPFVPDGSFQATNSEIDIPPDPPTPRLSAPSTPTNGTRRATGISGRHLQPIDRQDSRFTDHEVDSDITPVVPEYPRQNTPQSSQTQNWDGDTFNAVPDEIPTRKEGSGSRHPAINFPDESTDVREIQEDWRNKLQQTGRSDDPNKVITPSSQNIPAPPANLFGEIEPVQKAPTSFRDWEDEEEADLSELSATGDQDELQQVTEVYSSPGEAFYIPQTPSSKDDKRSTIAYDFPAPGKPPKPKS